MMESIVAAVRESGVLPRSRDRGCRELPPQLRGHRASLRQTCSSPQGCGARQRRRPRHIQGSWGDVVIVRGRETGSFHSSATAGRRCPAPRPRRFTVDDHRKPPPASNAAKTRGPSKTRGLQNDRRCDAAQSDLVDIVHHVASVVCVKGKHLRSHAIRNLPAAPARSEERGVRDSA